MENSVKILISYHKKDSLLKDEILTPINAGRELAIRNNSKDIEWLKENCIGDNTGENISSKNKYYNEMTSIFWAWKNYDKLGNPDYIGHFHYRRHLAFYDTDNTVIEAGDINENYLKEIIHYEKDNLDSYFEKYDLIIPKAQYRSSAYEHFKRNFDISDLDEAISILNELYPSYYSSAINYLQGNKLYFCNIFLMKKNLFFNYCDFVFSILSKLEESIDFSNKRMYVSEWLTGIFFQKQIEEGEKRICYLPTVTAQGHIDIPIAISFDNNYFIQAGVMLTSLLENAKESTVYDIRCLVDVSIAEEKRKILKSLCDKYRKHKISFYDIDDEIINKVIIKTEHLSKSALYRLLIGDLMHDIDKIIYLDIDVVICQDLTVLYRYALDNNYIAGVRAPGYYSPDNWRKEKLEELSIPNMNTYINSGVLVMALDKIRNDNLTNEFLKLVRNNYRSEDQDVLNKACYGKIKILPFRFNVQTKYLGKNSKEKNKLIGIIPEDELSDAKNNPVIIHYANPIKPWNNSSIYEGERWLEYAHISGMDLSGVYAEKIFISKEKGRDIDEFIKTIKPADYSCVRFNKTDENLYSVSIIIPCYNCEKTISETIKSCLLQEINGIKVEVICINDGSTDRTLSILEQWADKYKNIKVITQTNSGAGKARNVGIKLAKGEFLAFMDADDYYPSPSVLDNLYHSANKNRVEIAGGCMASFDGRRDNSNYEFPLDGYIFKERGVINYSDYQFDFGYQRFIYRRRLIKNNNIKFPLHLRYQDPPFFVQAMICAGKFMAVKEISYIYRVNHKKINWTEEKICGFINGIRDNLRIFSENKLWKGYYLTYLRLLDNVDNIRGYIVSSNFRVTGLISDLINEIDYLRIEEQNSIYKYTMVLSKDALRKIISEEITILSGRDNQENLLNNINDLEQQISELNYIISETRKSFSYRLGLFFTAIPRKIRELINH